MFNIHWIALLLLLVASASLFVARNWRWNILALAGQYAAVFWFVQNEWGLALAAVKLITGWMICAALGLAHNNIEQTTEGETSWPQGRLFRLATLGIAVIFSLAAGGELRAWMGLPLPLAWGAVFLISGGILIVGITSQPFRAIMGLLTILAGFETIYAAVENSVLVAGLLAAINLGLALVGAYYINLPLQEETS